MPNIPLAGAAVLRALLLSALVVGVADVEAKGKIRIGSNVGHSSKSTSSKAAGDKDDDGKKDSGGYRPQVNLRQSSAGTSSQPGSSPRGTLVPFQPAGGQPANEDPEEAARRVASIERAQAEKAAARRAAAEQAEAERIAAEKSAAEQAAQKAAEDKAESARQAAALEKKKREEAAVAADVDRVLERAKNDYPVLRAAEGEPVLQQILARQKVLVGRGMYPSIAMVEALADHQHALAPREKQAAPVATATQSTAAPKSFGGCRWITPTQWGCDK
jgi:hypothetical protein